MPPQSTSVSSASLMPLLHVGPKVHTPPRHWLLWQSLSILQPCGRRGMQGQAELPCIKRMWDQNSAAEGGRLSSARARLARPAGWAVGCRSATCNRGEAAGLCGQARQRHARQGAAPHPAEPMPPRPGHSVVLPAGAAAAHSQSVPVSRPSFLPLAQDSSARSAGEERGVGAARQPRCEVARAGRQAGAGTRWHSRPRVPGFFSCFGDNRSVSPSPSPAAAPKSAMAEASANASATRMGLACGFDRGSSGFRGRQEAAMGQELELAQAGASRASREARAQDQQRPARAGCCAARRSCRTRKAVTMLGIVARAPEDRPAGVQDPPLRRRLVPGVGGVAGAPPKSRPAGMRVQPGETRRIAP